MVRFLGLPIAIPLALLLAGIAGGLLLGNGVYIGLFVAGVTLSPIALTLRGIGKSLHILPPAVQRDLEQNGSLAPARIERLSATGTTINEARVAELELIVVPRDRGAYRTTTRQLIPVLQAPAFQPGNTVVVRQSPAYPGVVKVEENPNVALPGAPLEVGVVGETYSGRPDENADRGRARWPMIAGMAVVLAAALLLPIREDVIAGITTPDLLASDELSRGVARMSEAAGNQAELLSFDSDALRAQTPRGWVGYRGGSAELNTDAEAKADPDRLFDMRRLNLAAVPGLIRTARTKLALEENTPVTVSVSRDPGKPVELRISEADNARSGTLYAAADGTAGVIADATTAEGAREVFGALTARMGATKVFDARISRDSVELTAPTRPGADTADDFSWHSGRLPEREPASIQPDEGAPTFDLATFDPAVLPGLVTELAKRSGEPEKAREATFTLELQDGELGLHASVNGDYRSTRLTAKPDGSGVRVVSERN